MSGNSLKEDIQSALREVIDPELGVNVIDLGLIYDLKIQDDELKVVMTTTSPVCPLNAYLTDSIKKVVLESFPQIKSVEVEIVWEPPWSPQKMSEHARRLLGY